MIRIGITETTEAVTMRKIEIVTRNIIHMRFWDLRFGVAIIALALLPTNCIDGFSEMESVRTLPKMGMFTFKH